jgi:hypothetical protein
VPVPVPFRFPLQNERWFPSSTSVPPTIPFAKNAFAPGLPPYPIVTTTNLHTENRPPPQQLDEGAVGLRLTGLTRAVDWSLVYYDGPETAPGFDLATTVFAPDPSSLTNPNNTKTRHLSSDETLLPRHARIQLAGGDAAVVLGGFTVRGEMAYGEGRLLPRTTLDLLSPENIFRAVGGQQGAAKLLAMLADGKHVPLDLGDLFVARDVVQWGVGIDYLIHGWIPLLQLNQTIVLHNHVKLLIDDVDTQLAFDLQRPFFDERLRLEVSAAWDFSPGYELGVASATWAIRDDLRLQVGYLLIAGSRNSIVGQYHDNDEAFARLRWSF